MKEEDGEVGCEILELLIPETEVGLLYLYPFITFAQWNRSGISAGGSSGRGGSSQRKKGSDYFTSPVKTMTLRDIK